MSATIFTVKQSNQSLPSTYQSTPTISLSVLSLSNALLRSTLSLGWQWYAMDLHRSGFSEAMELTSWIAFCYARKYIDVRMCRVADCVNLALCTRLKVKKPHETEERKKGRKGESRGAKSVSVSQSVSRSISLRRRRPFHCGLAWV